MKIARRLLSILLAALMIFALAACGGGNSEPTDPVQGSEDKTPVGSDTDDDVSVPEKEFELPDRPVDETEGKNYIIIQHGEVENPFGYSQDSNMGLQISGRILDICETYGCTVEFVQMAWTDSFASQLQSLVYSEDGGDLIYADNNAKLRLALGIGGSESMCQNLLQVDHIIDFWNFDKWGNITSRECMMAGGTFYGVSPALWVGCTPLPYYQIVYNKDIIETAGTTDPQEYWEKNEWDREAMLSVIQDTTDESAGIWGMTASQVNMVRASFLTVGIPLVVVDKINPDGSVEWSRGLESPDAIDALQWLKNTLTANKNCFKGPGVRGWAYHEPFNREECAMAMTRPSDLFSYVVVDGPANFGVTTWAGAEPNTLTGYYEDVASVAIPVFAQNIEHSAFLMYDIFEGLEGIETYEDIIAYYGETYFSSETDLQCLVREGATLQYAYWPNGLDQMWYDISGQFMTSSSILSLVNRYAASVDEELETHVLPNTVALEAWKQAGYFD